MLHVSCFAFRVGAIKLCLFLVGFAFVTELAGQDTVTQRNLYRPYKTELQDTIRPALADSSVISAEREKYVRDSIVARQNFVRDSLLSRQRILDSLTFLKRELSLLLAAYFRVVSDQIILKCDPLQTRGDSVLDDFTYITMPFGVREPYTPWKKSLTLSGKPVKFTLNNSGDKIVSIHTSQIKASFVRSSNRLLIIHRPPLIQNNSQGKFYKIPVDSVFYNSEGEISTIKSYVLFHALINANQKGNLLFTNSTEFRKYEYNPGNDPAKYQVVRYCERWNARVPNKVCTTINYRITRQGGIYTIERRNDPANGYSDGTYTLIYDDRPDLKGISFENLAGTENWQRKIELNKDGYVSCYVDQSGERIIQSLCMIYHSEADARYPVETITTTFEKDGISYLQTNNTTGKIRMRDRMTLEWSPWR